mgnify:CR=1 FL=1
MDLFPFLSLPGTRRAADDFTNHHHFKLFLKFVFNFNIYICKLDVCAWSARFLTPKY